MYCSFAARTNSSVATGCAGFPKLASGMRREERWRNGSQDVARFTQAASSRCHPGRCCAALRIAPGVVARKEFRRSPRRRLPIVVDPLPSGNIEAALSPAAADTSARACARPAPAASAGGDDALGGAGSEVFASARFISSWLALSSPMAFELSLAICCWFALSCSMFRSNSRDRARSFAATGFDREALQRCCAVGAARRLAARLPEPGVLLAVVLSVAMPPLMSPEWRCLRRGSPSLRFLRWCCCAGATRRGHLNGGWRGLRGDGGFSGGDVGVETSCGAQRATISWPVAIGRLQNQGNDNDSTPPGTGRRGSRAPAFRRPGGGGNCVGDDCVAAVRAGQVRWRAKSAEGGCAASRSIFASCSVRRVSCSSARVICSWACASRSSARAIRASWVQFLSDQAWSSLAFPFSVQCHPKVAVDYSALELGLPMPAAQRLASSVPFSRRKRTHSSGPDQVA